jgi:hypothetical protein
MMIAMPFVILRGGAVRRLRPLLIFFWIALIFGLGGTTPIPKLLLRRAFEILTFERFTLMACVMALPIVGSLVADLVDRFQMKAALAVAALAIATLWLSMSWMYYTPYQTMNDLDVDPVINFLNRDGHDKFRFLTLGFGNAFPRVSTYANAQSIDGEYHSARLLPEMTRYGSAQLTNSKFFGRAGMESLRAMLNHANRYGLKFIFIRDPFYNPLVAFAGWRQVETFDSGLITVWAKEDVPPAHKIMSDAIPAPWEGLMWGTLPFGCSLLAIVLAILWPDRVRALEVVRPTAAPAPEPVYAREAH